MKNVKQVKKGTKSATQNAKQSQTIKDALMKLKQDTKMEKNNTGDKLF